MKEPEFNYDALKAGVENIEKGLKSLEATKRGAERQKASAEEVICCISEEIQRQVQQRSEFCKLIRQHEKWRREFGARPQQATE